MSDIEEHLPYFLKASDLIKELTAFMEEHGDLYVTYDSGHPLGKGDAYVADQGFRGTDKVKKIIILND